MKPVSVIFSRERVVGGEKVSLGFQAEIEGSESPDDALKSVKDLVETRLSALAPSPEEQARIERKKQAEERARAIEEEAITKKQQLLEEFSDVLPQPEVPAESGDAATPTPADAPPVVEPATA